MEAGYARLSLLERPVCYVLDSSVRAVLEETFLWIHSRNIDFFTKITTATLSTEVNPI
jgi:hypothetical protein